MATSATQSDSGPRSSRFDGDDDEEFFPAAPLPSPPPSALSTTPSSTARTVNAILFPSLDQVTKLMPDPSGSPVTGTSTAEGIPSLLASAAGTTTPSPSRTTDSPV